MIAVRFAPSPTGYLHIGGARTAIFNWLFAKKHEGKFFLRIEDTDQKRSGEQMVRAILDGLSWLGLGWDGEPIRQSHRLQSHKQYAERLLEMGKAYRCFASPEELSAARTKAQQAGREFRVREAFPPLAPDEEQEMLLAGRPATVRFAIPAGETEFEDSVYGKITVAHETIDDFVILRSDGVPTYQLAVVVDDHEMAITHVIRGADHLSNTPKQILLYRALGLEPPTFAHVPLILGLDKTRLSKRHGATAVGEYESRGILPEALLNFLALLGWSSGDDTEIFTREELIAAFSLEGVSKANAIFDERKLEWMNGEYIKNARAEELEEAVRSTLIAAGVDEQNAHLRQPGYLRKVISLLQSRAKYVVDFARIGSYFFEEPEQFDQKARAKHWQGSETAAWLNELAQRLARLRDFSEGEIESCVRELAAELGIAAGKLIHPARVALTGFGVSPGIFETMALIGQERVTKRLQRAVGMIQS